ncbi:MULTISPECIES: TniQ family protein [Microbacterium]|uniref:TniQ domain-containing protein n=3 Tax=Microbacterium TaxID=33882 RepID=A0A9W6HNY6_9MICO|nr:MULTISPECIES: TniQ family protein [Microbacterium]KAB1881649.1 TniQ family protein [Microbacterium liquefaciens]MBM7461659.1 AraC-like DNA-binding protein [Microbacterium dextranolyticum]GLJ96682.1 hypothetical protein GCM10017591_27450 [Microbacterium dextranolyticum]
MTELRRLPFRVRPMPDEPLDSWLETMAAAHGVTFGQMIVALGLSGPAAVEQDQHYSVGRLNRWSFHLDEGPLERLIHTTGLSADCLQAMTRSAFASTVTKYTLKGRLSIQCPTAGTQGRFCPECLLDSGGRWRLSWTYAFVSMCPRHRRVLSDICPSCGEAPRARPQPMYLVPRPGCCHNRPHRAADPRQRCGADLRDETGRVEASTGMLAAQRAQFATISQGVGRFGMYRDNPQAAPLVMEDLRTIARIAVRALVNGEDIDAGDIPSATLGKALDEDGILRKERPRTSALAALGASLAFQAVQDPDRLFKLLHGRIPPSAVFDQHSLQLKVSVARSRGLNMRHLTHIQHLVPPPPSGAKERARKLPAQIWPEWAAQLRIPKTDPELAAAAVSTAVMIAGTRLSHVEALEMLGSPLPRHRVRDTTRLLRDTDPAKNLLLPIARLAIYLDAENPPIDYARRRALDYASLLPAVDWNAIAARVNTRRGGAPRLRQIRLLLYSWLSGNHPDQAPQLFRPHSAAEVTNARELAASLSHELELELLNVARRFLEAHRINEPVRWSPPLDVADWNPTVDDAERTARWPVNQPAREHLRTTFTFSELVDEYRSGRALKDLASDSGVGRSVISRVLKEAGIELRPAHAPRQVVVDDDRIRVDYQNGRTLEAIARELGCSESTVARRLRLLDVQLRARGGRTKDLAEVVISE